MCVCGDGGDELTQPSTAWLGAYDGKCQMLFVGQQKHSINVFLGKAVVTRHKRPKILTKSLLELTYNSCRAWNFLDDVG